MQIALLADIHANRQAFSACLRHAEERGAERYVLLGDFVGYGADPVYAVDTAMELVSKGAIAVLGNHDSAVNDPTVRINPEAQAAIDWTRGLLGVEERRFLADLPLIIPEQDRLYVHADASAPAKWIYVLTVEEASRSLYATKAQITFCGHTHKPGIFSVTAAAKMTAFSPVTEVAVPLHGLRRWLVVLGRWASRATVSLRRHTPCSTRLRRRSPSIVCRMISREPPRRSGRRGCHCSSRKGCSWEGEASWQSPH